MSDPVHQVTSEYLVTHRIGFVPTCTALVAPKHLVRFECGQPVTHVRLTRRTDDTTTWRSVCPAHTTEPLD